MMRLLITIVSFLTALNTILKSQETDDYYHGIAEMEKGNYLEAISYFGSVISTNNKNSSCYLKRAECLYQLNRYSEAMKDLEKTEEIKKDQGSYLLAKIYAKTGEHEKSIFYLREHLTSQYKLPESTIKLDEAFSTLENTPEWRELWKNEWYNHLESVLAEVEYMIRSQDYTDALELIDKNLKDNAHRHQLHALKGKVYLQLGNYNNAVSALSNALELTTRQPEYFINRATAFSKLKKYNKAISDYNAAIKLSPEDLKLYFKRGLIHYLNIDYEAAVEDFIHYRKYFPGDNETIYYTGMAYYAQGKYLKALENFNELLCQNSDKGKYFHARGNTYLQTKTYQYAINDYSMALDLDPYNPEIYLNKGMARFRLGDIEGACNDWNKSLHYGHPEAGKYLEQYCNGMD